MKTADMLFSYYLFYFTGNKTGRVWILPAVERFYRKAVCEMSRELYS